MGLDVTAYSGLKLIGNEVNYEDWEENYDWAVTVYVYPGQIEDHQFPDAIVGHSLEAGGVYEYGEKFSFAAGSYSGYNYWREQLCIAALGVKPEEVWKNPSQYRERPFYNLINFSDCEGIIAAPVAASLAKDFADYEEQVKAFFAEDSAENNWLEEAYDDWKHAFELAADGGLVYFH